MSVASGPIHEILSYLASEDLQKDETLTHAAFEKIRMWKGLQHIYEGTGIEEPNRRWLIIVWDTYEDHKRLMDDKELYPQVLEKLEKCMGGEAKRHHVLFSDNTRIALTSPVTEIANFQLRPGASKLEFEEHMRSLTDHARDAPRASEHAPFVFGETREKEGPGAYFFIGGWTTKQHHLDCIADPQGIKSQVEKIGVYSTCKIHHLTVKEYGLRRD